MTVRARGFGCRSQWRMKGIAKCAYVRSANCKVAQNCAEVVYLSYYQIEIFPLYLSKYVDVVYLFALRVNLMIKL
jgi:hypothetical protein